MSAKWDYIRTTSYPCGEPCDEYYFTRGDEPKEWTLHETAQHLSAMDVVLAARSAEIAALRVEVERLRAALRSITECNGAFSRDQLTHAENTIEAMKKTAIDALAGKEKEEK